MRKATLFIFTCILVLILFLLCSCGDVEEKPETVEKAIGEMTFVPPEDLDEERDEKTVMQILIDQGAYDSVDQFEKQVDEAQYYYGKNFDLAVSTSYVPYMNSDIEQCMKDVYGGAINEENLQDIDIDGVQGKLGHYKESSTENYYLHILSNGLYYDFTISLIEGNDYPENCLEDIAETITFNAIGKKQITCGDISLLIPQNYQSLEFEHFDGLYDEQYLGQFGDTYRELGILYMLCEDVTVAEAIDFQVEEFSLVNVQRSSGDCALTKYELATGNDEIGDYYAIAMFEYEGKIYAITLCGESIEDIQHIKSILQSVEDAT